MAEITTLPSPKQHKRPISSLPFFTTFDNPKPEPESITSPTSTLDSKPFSSEPEHPKTRPWNKPGSRGIGLTILSDERPDPKDPNTQTRTVLFGSHLKIQIPTQPESPKPPDFGIRTRNGRIGSGCSVGSPNSGRVLFGSISAKEMELSEEYTCVITHGPNPKTTHIFDNCVVLELGDRTVGFCDRTVGFGLGSFLRFCCTCKRNLGQGKDIYMYRGDKAFCSNECRYEEILLEEQEED